MEELWKLSSVGTLRMTYRSFRSEQQESSHPQCFSQTLVSVVFDDAFDDHDPKTGWRWVLTFLPFLPITQMAEWEIDMALALPCSTWRGVDCVIVKLMLHLSLPGIHVQHAYLNTTAQLPSTSKDHTYTKCLSCCRKEGRRVE
ncbi:hypothetical protein RvY_13648 [Ramazzottius varieornatus]|uniref:Uncharacterized protein n=1 Tax=Ramazzottius varieornatus TaxID=947166 RepID=A0A1D1VW22_RAMVA|nr:hypothetical protein RvY_13648 [Ramazzottius varieornatus]